MKRFLLLVWLVFWSTQSFADHHKIKPETCSSSREYITALRFLRHHKEFKILEPEAQKVADVVSQGCTGAAQRFIEVTNLLIKTGVGSKQAIQKGVRFAKATQPQLKTYIHVFRKAFVSDYLDLDLPTASRLSEDLSINFSGDPKNALKDFERISEFCLEESGLDLTKPACSYLAWDVAKIGERFEKGASESFLDVLDFIQDEKGAARSIGEAIAVSLETIQYGPKSVENFKNGYRFAMSQSGLKQGYFEAIKFARKMASRSFKESSDFKLIKTSKMQRRLGSTR